VDAKGEQSVTARPSQTGRQQTGRQQHRDLKSVVHVAGLVFDASHTLLQLSDGSVVRGALPPRSEWPSIIANDSSAIVYHLHWQRYVLVLWLSSEPKQINVPHAGRLVGHGIVCRGELQQEYGTGGKSAANNTVKNVSKPQRYWGFNRLKKRRKQAAVVGSAVLRAASNVAPAASLVGVFLVNVTPVPAAKNSRKIHSVSPSELTPISNKSIRLSQMPPSPEEISVLEK